MLNDVVRVGVVITKYATINFIINLIMHVLTNVITLSVVPHDVLQVVP